MLSHRNKLENVYGVSIIAMEGEGSSNAIYRGQAKQQWMVMMHQAMIVAEEVGFIHPTPLPTAPAVESF